MAPINPYNLMKPTEIMKYDLIPCEETIQVIQLSILHSQICKLSLNIAADQLPKYG